MMIYRRQKIAGGKIRLVTLAPAVPGVLKLPEFLGRNGVRVDVQRSGRAVAALESLCAQGTVFSGDRHRAGGGCEQTIENTCA